MSLRADVFENGFLMDDGVVARIDEDTFLCHTTSGGADRIHAHMEEWLQTECIGRFTS